ncbi:MAG: polysaccharide deacetylase family protein [Chitinophagales bacterium]
MAPYHKTNFLFLLLGIVLLWAVYFQGLSVFFLPAFALVYLLVIGYGSWDIQLHFHFKTFNKADADQKYVAITFDDGPTEYTPRVLDILEKHKVKAAFFCIGENIEKHPEILKQIHASGHIIGNHSYGHGYFFDFLNAKGMIAETDKTDALIEKLIGKKPIFFRPPYGITNPAVKKTVQRKNYKAIGWSIRSMDTVNKNTESVSNKVISNLHPGGIILFHDSHERISAILERTLKGIYSKGYKIVPLDELLNLPPYD